MMRRWVVLLLGGLVLFGVGQVHGAVISYRVAQESAPGAGDFDSHVLGFIDPFVTDMSASEYYAYGDPNSFNGPAPALIANRSHWFLVEASDGLSLFIVHNAKHGGGVNGGANMRIDLTGDPDGAQFLVKDDPEELAWDTGPTLFTTQHNWGGEWTDGAVIGSLEGSWAVYGQLRRMGRDGTGAEPYGLDSWAAYSADGSVVPLQLDLFRRVRIDPIPEPSTFAIVCGLFGMGLAGHVWRRHRGT